MKYMDARYTVISCSHITVTYIHQYTCIDCSYILIIWVTVHITGIIVACIFLYSCYMIVSRYWYWYSRYWTCELLINDGWNPTSLVFHFPLSCFMLSTELMSCYRVTCNMHCTCSWCTVYFTYNKYNLRMGETWRLTRSYRVDVWIHCLSHCKGRGSVGYRLL